MDFVDVGPASGFASREAISSFIEIVITVESSGNPDARPVDPATGKPRSSAFGAAQFIEGTWLAMVRKYRPDLAAQPDDEILDLRADFAMSREITARYTEENAAYLRKHGVRTTPGALYLAHFAGPTGAAKLLKAKPDTAVEDILSEEAIKANPFLEGKTVSAVYAWAKSKISKTLASNAVTLAASGSVTPYRSVAGQGSADQPTRTAAAKSDDSLAEKPLASRKVTLVLGGVVRVVTKS